MLLNSARSLAADLANHSTSDRAPPWLNLFISGAKSDQIWEIFHEWVYLYPVYFLLSWGGVKGRRRGGVLLIIYSVNFNPATYLMLQILQETFN